MRVGRQTVPRQTAPRQPAGPLVRAFRGAPDILGMTEANNAMRLAAGSIELMTPGMIEAQYANLSGSDPARDVFVAELGGRIVGYARSEQADTTDGVREHMAVVFAEPGAYQRAVCAALLDACETRSRDKVAAAADTGAAAADTGAAAADTGAAAADPGAAAGAHEERRIVQGAFAWDADRVYTEMLLERGYRPVRTSYEMIRATLDDIPDLPLPDGIEVRPVLPEHYRTIFQADVEAFADHWGWVDGSDSAYRRFLEDPTFQPELWTIAWDGDRIAGQVRAYIIDEDNERLGVRRGWTENISVRKPWRSRGIAKSLMAASMRLQRDHGMTETALTVDAQNETGALQLYRSMGFEVHSSQTQYRRPLDLDG
jgi:mycothiol synthase